MKRAVIVLLCLAMSGCALFKRGGTIKSGGVTVAAVADAGRPATLNSASAKESIGIPKDTVVTVTEHAATPTVPAYKVTEFRFNAPTEWQKFDTSVVASTGTVDTTVAVKKVEAAESRPLLYAALAALVAAGVFVYLHYPTPAFMCAGCALIFFLAWKLSSLPEWTWAVGAIGLAAAGFLYLGHEKGLSATATPTPAK